MALNHTPQSRVAFYEGIGSAQSVLKVGYVETLTPLVKKLLTKSCQ
jgi:hypothetical protein